ncbi:IclR family transcriptional regulator [Labrenzia sp. PHM005]|uniref:IclR family transcriptional regulator n=1 Tax=Labrenzia sp. PHM005 TaxID=2590016 RepID=UPI0011400C71|nr:IclR family transcriptional regulator [Labrenzia sp. PHM005]QDG76336.1 IclR family transcriptional regulator [Labrenzia sp. PHM005]
MKSKQDTLFVASLEKGFRILEAFDEDHPELGLAELSQKTELDKSAVQRFSNTLTKLGYLKKDEITKRYRPTIKTLELANAYLWSDRLTQLAMPKLIDLSKILNGTVNMSVLDGTDIIYVVRLPSRRTNFAATIIGRRVPALNTSSGRAILSVYPKPYREEAIQTWPLKQFTPKTTMDRNVIEQIIETAAVKGYSRSSNELIMNEIGFAAPILASDGQPLAAVQCSVSSFTHDEKLIETKLVPTLMETVASLQPGHLG